jgi:uncharacterized protein
MGRANASPLPLKTGLTESIAKLAGHRFPIGMRTNATPQDASIWLRPALVAPWREIALVLFVLLGPFIWSAIRSALHGSSRYYLAYLLSDFRMLSTAAREAALLALFLYYLHRRGWTVTDLKARPGWRSSLQGIALIFVTALGNAVTVFGLYALLFHLQTRYVNFIHFLAAQHDHIPRHGIHLSWLVLFGAVILNAYFEELVCLGFAFNQIAAKWGPLAALLLTVLIRMSYHTYQGPIHMLGIGMVFLIAGAWYWRTRNLWTQITFHLFVDLASMCFIKWFFG